MYFNLFLSLNTVKNKLIFLDNVGLRESFTIEDAMIYKNILFFFITYLSFLAQPFSLSQNMIQMT